jgi:xanthine dehydrogenase accessory factor
LDFIGFEYVVIDDRQEFLTRERFPQAKAFVLHDFDNVFETLALIPHSSYLIIVTRGHKFDLTVLHQAMRADAKYVGMIGSSRKIKLLFQQLQEQGVEQALLDKVHAPIGLEIEADTPEEIAISIAAELIKIRRSEE